MTDIIVNTPKRLRDLSRTKLVETIERQRTENAEFLETMRQRFERGRQDILAELRWTAESRNRLLSYCDDLCDENDVLRAQLRESRWRLDRMVALFKWELVCFAVAAVALLLGVVL